MYFIILGGESASTNKFGCPDPVALRKLQVYCCKNEVISVIDSSQWEENFKWGSTKEDSRLQSTEYLIGFFIIFILSL